MADFSENLRNFRPSFSFLDHVDPSMEQINQFSILDNASLNYQSLLPFPNDNFFSHQAPEFSGNLAENFPGVFHQSNSNYQNVLPVSQSTDTTESQNKKRKNMEIISESSYENFSPVNSDNKTKRKNNSGGRRKRGKGNEKEEETPKEVVHVRARRGQATDSHSLAERVRRGKINERLRCLQDIVPGCYKTMGMAMMLDEIINYVQSLQNQVEFLSMKLTAASTFYDFNSESDAIETMQRAKAYKAKEMENMKRNGYGGFDSSSSSLTRPV